MPRDWVISSPSYPTTFIHCSHPLGISLNGRNIFSPHMVCLCYFLFATYHQHLSTILQRYRSQQQSNRVHDSCNSVNDLQNLLFIAIIIITSSSTGVITYSSLYALLSAWTTSSPCNLSRRSTREAKWMLEKTCQLLMNG